MKRKKEEETKMKKDNQYKFNKAMASPSLCELVTPGNIFSHFLCNSISFVKW